MITLSPKEASFMTAREVIARLKGVCKNAEVAFLNFIAIRQNHPELQIREFRALFNQMDEQGQAQLLEGSAKLPRGWVATHIDSLTDRKVMIQEVAKGVFEIVWDHGLITRERSIPERFVEYIDLKPLRKIH